MLQVPAKSKVCLLHTGQIRNNVEQNLSLDHTCMYVYSVQYQIYSVSSEIAVLKANIFSDIETYL